MSSPLSPAGGGQPLQPVSHNAQRESALFASVQLHERMGESPSGRDSSVHEKINQFNTLAMHSKTLERKTADAALKRAMLGREEAEAEARRYRDEVMVLRKEVEEGKKNERKVGERLEAVMENSGRAKEMYAHSQQRWEKEIRRSRKETFKVQSTLVKAQEELKSCRTAQKATEEELHTERERSKAREQEAFDAQYRLVGLQEQLGQALARAKMLEQELEAMRTLAKNDTEVKRTTSTDERDDSEGPRKRARLSSVSSFGHGNPEIETITMLWEWEKQRADRALEQVDFLEAECQLKVCSAGKELRKTSVQRSSTRKRTSMLISDAGDSMILSESRRASAEMPMAPPKRSKTDQLRKEKEPRRSTIFLPEEGIFRTVSQAEADAMAAKSTASSGVSPTEAASSVPITPTDNNPMYRRTPSLDPPDFAVLNKQRTSLLSLLDAPHRQEPAQVFNIPTTPGPAAPGAHHVETEDEADARHTAKPPAEIALPPRQPTISGPLTEPLPSHSTTAATATIDAHTRPHTTASHYRPSTSTTSTVTTTTTTKVPLREEPDDESGPTLAQRLMKMQRTPSRQTGDNHHRASDGSNPDGPSFDTSNPALTPTMTREQALAQIRERRGRARSVGRVGSAGSSSAAAAGASAGAGAGASAGAVGNGSRAGSSQSQRAGEVRRKVSGSSATGEVRRKVSGSGPGGAEVRRKVSGDLGATARRAVGGEERGRERDVRREVSAPTASGAAGTIRGSTAGGVRRIRS
ncbi:uncharacterized protein B0H64DRAFT_364322 [Chaetomium fimeti]|uniref:Uncharacterized protein n=1 Tax=Chaetomium fimeti TaxID=1854472 RepID=A0AAE0HBP2_9PEZI|nr:hypothetical protein B0H64DRAFT_364322 [Chaetomium fimeti]